MKQLEAGGKLVTLYGAVSSAESCPVVFLNTVMDEGEKVYTACRKLGAPPFVLAAVGRPVCAATRKRSPRASVPSARTSPSKRTPAGTRTKRTAEWRKPSSPYYSSFDALREDFMLRFQRDFLKQEQ